MKKNDLLTEGWIFNSERLCVYDCASLLVSNQVVITKKIVEVLTPKVVKALPGDWQGIKTVEQASNWLQQRLNESRVLAISIRLSGEVIGFIFIHENEGVERFISINIGYVIGEPYWKKGYASEALSALVSYYKSLSKAYTILAGVEVGNNASIRVLEKCGFELTKSEIAPNGNLFYKKNI